MKLSDAVGGAVTIDKYLSKRNVTSKIDRSNLEQLVLVLGTRVEEMFYGKPRGEGGVMKDGSCQYW